MTRNRNKEEIVLFFYCQHYSSAWVPTSNLDEHQYVFVGKRLSFSFVRCRDIKRYS